MRHHQASRTAAYMALFRAIETTMPPAARLFDDPFAHLFLPAGLRMAARAGRWRAARRLMTRYIDRRWPGARPSGVARTRLIDDWLCAAIGDDAAQIVILGAGYDCRPYRLNGIGRTVVFEVDHPATLEVRRRRLAKLWRKGGLASAERNPSTIAVPIDFNVDDLERRLLAAGYRPQLRTVFIWEGVTNYLTRDAVARTLAFVAASAAGGELVFTYVHRDVLEQPDRFAGTERLHRALARAGEPWTFGLHPDEIGHYLAERGLQLIEDVGSVEYRRRYMAPCAGTVKGYEFYRAARARITGSPVPSGDRAGPVDHQR
jgi:methyltransferase (TIGR00027 family)